jgi:hypothetical protein
LLLDGIHRSGGNEAERSAYFNSHAQGLTQLHRIQSNLAGLHIPFHEEAMGQNDRTWNSAASIFLQLYEASVMRKQILEV